MNGNDNENGSDNNADEPRDEASKLWTSYARKKQSEENAGRPWLVIAIVVGLFVLLTGLYIVAFG
jgi:hypothetical protein